MKMKCNCCDGIYHSFDIHFTSACDNDCAHCIDKQFMGSGIKKPDPKAIAQTIIDNQEDMEDVLFLGGEPCLFLEEMNECIDILREKTKLKLYVTTSVPKTCYDNYDLFRAILSKIDGLNISVQHHDERVADFIRRTESKFDRQKFYRNLPYKEKIRVNLNIVKPFLSTKEDLTRCLKHYDSMGFNSIKLSEIQHGTEVYISFADIFGINLESPYSSGCQSYINMNKIIPGFKTPLLLKRSCFICENTQKASLLDGIKVIGKLMFPSKTKYGVVYEDGTMTKGWV